MPLPCAAAKSCSKATRADAPPRSPLPWAVLPKPFATPCAPSPPRGWAACTPSRRLHTLRTAWPKDHDQDLRALLHQSPRALGKETSLWTLPLAALVCHEKGWTPRRLSGETIRLVLKRLGVTWKRAKHWLTSPDPEYARKKNSATG